MDDLREANALLTGAAGGLGTHIARALATRGVRIAASGRRIKPLERLCRDLRRDGANAHRTPGPGEACRLFDETRSLLGPFQLARETSYFVNAAVTA